MKLSRRCYRECRHERKVRVGRGDLVHDKFTLLKLKTKHTRETFNVVWYLKICKITLNGLAIID